MTNKIEIVIPTMGVVQTELVSRLEEYRCDDRVRVRYTANIQDVAAARNEAVLYHDPIAYTHLLFIDSDTVPPTGFLDRMLEVNHPVVSGVTHVWRPRKGCLNPRPMLAVWRRFKQKSEGHAYELIPDIPSKIFTHPDIVTGCFCMLVQSEVFNKIRTEVGLPWFKTEFMLETQQKTCSEDIYFIQKLHQVGIYVTILKDLLCDHYKKVSLADVALYGDICRAEARENERKAGNYREPETLEVT